VNKGSRLQFNPGALSHYVDPTGYRERYSNRDEDVEYYRRICRRARGPVLEYGCGNGRVSLALACSGVGVTAVDASRFMLRDLEDQLRRVPKDVRARVKLVRGDMRTLRLKRQYRLVIMPFNVFSHLYSRDDVERLLRRVRAHLLPGGRLVFDVYQPKMSELDGAVDGYSYDALTQILTCYFEGDPPSVLTQRQFFPVELTMLLKHNGFSRVLLSSDFEKRPIDEDTESIVVNAWPRATNV
jgi:SAM-dependent methyltransferase